MLAYGVIFPIGMVLGVCYLDFRNPRTASLTLSR